MAKFELEIELVRNYKAAARKGWAARVNVEEGKLEFLRAIEYSRHKATFEFKEGEFYIILQDMSSHKNSRQYYTLYLAKDKDLEEIASIEYENRSRNFDAIDDETKKVLKKAYTSAGKGMKTVTALVKTAQWYAQKHKIKQLSVEDKIFEDVLEFCEQHEITVDDLREILKRRDEE